jgi:hypothetical protein
MDENIILLPPFSLHGVHIDFYLLYVTLLYFTLLYYPQFA